jgi:hypothetical protein
MSDADLVRSASTGFAAQFARDGDAFLYRRSQKGPAIAVTVAERNAFVVAFDRWIDIEILVVLFGGIIAVMLAFVVFPLLAYPMIAITIGLGVVLAAVLLGLKLAWDAPARALAGRPVVAPALSRAEAHRLDVAALGWGAIGAQVVWAGLCFLQYFAHRETRWLAPIALTAGVGLLGLTAVRAYQKLRLR